MEHSQDVTKITLSLKNLSENDVSYRELNIVYRIVRLVYHYSPTTELVERCRINVIMIVN